MGTTELLETLRKEGFENAHAHVIGYGIQSGRLPRPPLSRSLQFVWGPKHIEAARDYLQQVPKPGRKKASAKAIAD